jgi:hypothetical protein
VGSLGKSGVGHGESAIFETERWSGEEAKGQRKLSECGVWRTNCKMKGMAMANSDQSISHGPMIQDHPRVGALFRALFMKLVLL